MQVLLKLQKPFVLIIWIVFIFTIIQSSNSAVNSGAYGIKEVLGILVVASSIQQSNTNPSSTSSSVLLSLPPTTTTTTTRKPAKLSRKQPVLPASEKYENDGISSSSSNDYKEFKDDRILTNKTRIGRRRRFKKKMQSKSTRKSRLPPYFDSKSKKNRQELNLNEQTDADSLRRKILTKLGEVDNLSCLPKALCGFSSRRQQQLKLSHQSPQKDGTEAEIGVDPFTLMEDQDSVNNYFQIMQTVLPDQSKSKKSQTPKKKKRKSKATKTQFAASDDNNDDSSAQSQSSEESNESDQSAEEMSEDDLEYYREKVEMENLMNEEDLDQETNWWDILPNTDPYPIATQTGNKDKESSMWPSFSSWRLPKGLGSFFGAMLPSMAWGLGKSPDVFQDDPFFQNMRSLSGKSLDIGKSLDSGRSLDGVQSKRGLKWYFGTPNQIGKRNKLKTFNKLKKKKRGERNEYLDKQKGEINLIDDPVEKFELAVEIGKQMDDPMQCDYIFNGCPFSYQEVMKIIESAKNNQLDGNDQTPINSDQNLQEFNYSPTLATAINADESIKIVNHSIPYGDDRLEISVKLLNSDETKLIPHVAVIKNPQNSPTEFQVPVSHIKEYDPEPTESFQTETPVLIPEEIIEQTVYRTEFPENSQKENTIYIETTTSTTERIVKPSSRKPMKKRRKQRPKKIRKQWGFPHYAPTKIVPTYILPPTKLPESSHESHVTNFHYYNSNPPSYNYYPIINQQSTTPATSIDKTTIKLKASVPFQEESTETVEVNKPTNRKTERSSEERIIIRLPESPNNNNYYNLFNNPLPLFNNYYTSHQPFHQNYHQPQSPTHQHYYHQNFYQQPLNPTHEPYDNYPPNNYQPQHHQPDFQIHSPFYPQSPQPLFPPPPPEHNSMLSYFFGKK